MKRDFEKEYRELVSVDIPDLWPDIEKRIEAQETEAFAERTDAEDPEVWKYEAEDAAPSETKRFFARGSGADRVSRRGGIKMFSKLLAIAACLCMAIMGLWNSFVVNKDAQVQSAMVAVEPDMGEISDYDSYDEPFLAAPAANAKEGYSFNGYEAEVEEAWEDPMAAGATSFVGSYEEDYLEDPWSISPSDGESYAKTETNGFFLTATSPLSTFSADVDTASYANVRRMIEDGYRLEEIPAGAVRPDEFLNYFQYPSLQLPGEGEKFGVTTQVVPCPWKDGHQLLMIGVRTEAIDLSEAPAENLTFLLDVSGSMADEDKLPLIKKAFRQLVEQLDEEDTVSIVTYANDVEIVLDSASGADRKQILTALDSLEAYGGTYGEGGIQKAYALAEANYKEGANNRILLATDGDLNIGISEPEELERLIKEKKESGIYLSVLGFGWGNIRDDNMERLADCGNGNYSYIDSLLEAKKVLVQEMGATFHTVAQDVKLQVEFNPANVNAYRLIGYEDRLLSATDFADDTKDAGEIGAGHSVVALYELIPAGSQDSVELKYQSQEAESEASLGNDYPDEYATVKIRYKEPGETVSALSEYVVDTSCFAQEPGEDLAFMEAVAEFAMILKQDENKGTSALESVQEICGTMDLRGDEYREEFKYLVRLLAKK